MPITFQTETIKSQPTWWRSPQRVLLRRALFQVHLWVGLIVTLYAVVIGVSGSALVFRHEIEMGQRPSLHHLQATGSKASVEDTVRRVEQERPGWKAFGLEYFEHPDQATMILMSRPGAPATSNYRTVFFNPSSGGVLLDCMHDDGAFGWLEDLHVHLLSGRTGLLVSGWMGVGLLVLAFTGLILWWPGVRRWRRSIMLSSTAHWRRMNRDLHTVVGFWTSAALMLVTFTGIYFVFPDAVGKGMERVLGGDLHARAAAQNPAMRAPAAGIAPLLTLDDAIVASYRVLPADAPPGYLSVPARPGGVIRVIGYYEGTAPFSQMVRIVLDPRTGALLNSISTRQETRAMRIEQYFVSLHFGSFGGAGSLGIVVKICWVLIGLTPALLAVTGLIMYWNRKLRGLWRTLARQTAKS